MPVDSVASPRQLPGACPFGVPGFFPLKSLFSFARLFFACLAIAFLSACMDGGDACTKPVVRFAVVADPHLYDTSLGTSGADYAAYLARDAKMLAQSETLFEHTVQAIVQKSQPPEFVIIPGDLTKDGAAASHQRMAACLETLELEGVEVYVVPGNHDVANPEAAAYANEGATQVYSPGPEEFAEIYRSFGYAQAIARDAHSLSYVAEPIPGFWLFAIDSCRYRENTDSPVVGGRLSAETLQWILENLFEARESRKTVVGMMHHGLVEHLAGQGRYLPDFLLADWATVARTLAAAGMNVVFTGHYHTQNITSRQWDDGVQLLEIQTGSLLVFPCPYRIVSLDGCASEIEVKSHFIEELPESAYPAGFDSFAGFAREFSRTHTHQRMQQELKILLNLPDSQVQAFAPLVTEAVMDHFAGDEQPGWEDFSRALELAASRDPNLSQIGLLLLSLYNDLPPADNHTKQGQPFNLKRF